MKEVDIVTKRGVRFCAARACALAVLGLVFLAPLAEARILIGRGIGPVMLGQTKAQVHHELGQPYQVSNLVGGGGWSAKGQAGWNYLRGPVFQVQFDRAGLVSGIVTNSQAQKTAAGVGVGSLLTHVLRVYPQAVRKRWGCELLSTSSAGDKIETAFELPYGGGRRVYGVSILDLTHPGG